MMYSVIFRTLLFLTLGISSICTAQSTVSIPLVDGRLKEFQAIAVGDTIIATYDTSPGRTKSGQINYLIVGEKKFTFESQAFKSKTILVGKNVNDSLFVYSLDIDRNLCVQAFHREETSLTFVRTTEIKLTGKMLVCYGNGHTRVITLDRKSSSLILYDLSGSQIISQRSFNLVPLLFERLSKAGDAAFVVHNNPSPVTIFEETKFYDLGTSILITIDERSGKRADLTTWISLDLESGMVTNRWLGYDDQSRFTTYYYQGKLIKVGRTKSTISIQVYDFASTALESEFTITKESEGTANKTYLINGPLQRTQLGAPIADKFNEFWNPFVLPIRKEGDDALYFRIGHINFDVKTTPSIYGFGVFTLMTQMISLATTLSTMNNIGEISYFYLKYDGPKSAIVPKVEGALDYLVEQYEMNLPTVLRYSERAYIRTNDSIVGFYLAKKTTDLRIVQFALPSK